MHWSDEYVEALKKRGGSHVIETGTSISGIPHVGNASDVIRGECVRKALVAAAQDAELTWVSDDSDPFRNVPAGMEKLAPYLGFPVKDIPDPEGCHKDFVDHFALPFIDDLAKFGVEPTIYSALELYRTGAFNEEIRTAFAKRSQIVGILNRFRETPLASDWVPWTPICEKCGRISTTKVAGLEETTVSYVCENKEVSGGEVTGCGHSGRQDTLKGMGKLPWRVEWAAKWHRFKVTCEPFGKDHAAAGGSYDTSSIISGEVFGWEPPQPVVYEFFTLNGAKISSSKGNVITLPQWLEISEPEVLRYFMFKKLNKARDINLKMLPNLEDEYDEAERLYFKKQEGDVDLAQMYELAQIGEPRYMNVPFTICAVLNQVASGDDVIVKAGNMGYEGFDPDRLKLRVRLAGSWVEIHGPEYLRFRLLSKEESAKEYKGLDEMQRKCLSDLVEEVKKKPEPEALHKTVYNTARANSTDPPKLFEAIYRVLIGKEKGPKAAAFMLTLGPEYLKARFSP
ncbi:MAG: lysine--tRNA ligase [Candidatus Altiarchaeota archaeon]